MQCQTSVTNPHLTTTVYVFKSTQPNGKQFCPVLAQPGMPVVTCMYGVLTVLSVKVRGYFVKGGCVENIFLRGGEKTCLEKYLH